MDRAQAAPTARDGHKEDVALHGLAAGCRDEGAGELLFETSSCWRVESRRVLRGSQKKFQRIHRPQGFWQGRTSRLHKGAPSLV